MKKFICLHCGANEYSSYDNGKPCQRCMGKMVEVKEEQHGGGRAMRGLLPCPFCGWAAIMREWTSGMHYYRAECSNTEGCDCHGLQHLTLGEAIAAWNRRTGNDTNVATNADRIRAKNDKELAEISVYCTTEPDYDEGIDGEWYECGEFEIWHSVFTADTYGSEDDAIAYTLDWLKQPVKEELI